MRRVTLRGVAARKLRLGLTALAIVLGVTFVAGTLVLGDTLDRTLNNVVAGAYQHVSFEIRGSAAFATNTPAAVEGTADRRPVPAWIAASVRTLPGVADVFGEFGGYAQFISPRGTAIGNGPGKAIGFAFDPDSQLNPYRLISGRGPVTTHEVVMDQATAQTYHFKVGDRVRVLLPAGSQTFTVSGLVTFGSDGNVAGQTLAEFDQATAQQLFHSHGYDSSINVLAKPGADNVELQHAIAKLLPPGVQVISGQALAGQLTGAIGNAVSRLTTLLLIFALISLFVGAFTIFNTFTITVGQRTRELALLRLVGASRRQVFASVLTEAALTGLVGALIGLGLGVIAALGLKALLGAFGVTLPPVSLVFEARTAIVALAVGIGVTVIAAIIPARHAVRVAPVGALAE
ncbi:MAG: ABC transporter permease, partial [Solirubrobacterales bacterium]|nr:ABC transporter permease [Solirubrobacterales bacterium]